MQAVFLRGDGRFDVIQPSEIWPKISEVRLDALSPRLGETQHLLVTAKSRVPVVSATALIETDRGTMTLRLASRGIPTPDPDDGSLQRYAFDGDWKVSGVRAGVVYHLTFIADDERGRASTATFAWSVESDD